MLPWAVLAVVGESIQPSMLASRAEAFLPSMAPRARADQRLRPVSRLRSVSPHLVTACGRGHTVCAESARDVLSEEKYKGILASFGGAPPPGRFLRGRHGATHYFLQSPGGGGDAPLKSLKQAGPSLKGLVLFAHGLGTNMHLYDEMVGPLLDDGFAVLRYDFFGHGWSAPDNKYFVYDKTVMLEQLEDLLDHVIGTGGKIHGFVGHSTGGCAAILAASHLNDYSFERLLLVSPCFWKQAPLVSTLAGKMPGVVMALLRWVKIDFKP